MAYYTADFVKWWHDTGSGIGPTKKDDMETHARSVAHAAWDAACLSTIMLLAKGGSKLNARLVMEDWRQVGTADSIYSTPLGVDLSRKDMHSGTTFEAVVQLPPDVAEEIETAWREHKAYPVLRLMPNKEICVNEHE